MTTPTPIEYKDYRDLLASIGVAFPYTNLPGSGGTSSSATVNLDFTDIVNNQPDVNASGWFKELMDSINAYVKAEFQADRITGNDYASVYLGSITDALASSLKFGLEKALTEAKLRNEKRNEELIAAQIRKIDFEIARAQQLLPLEKEKLQAETDLVKEQAKKAALETEISQATKQDQIDIVSNTLLKLQSDINLLGSKNKTEQEQLKVLSAQERLYIYQKNAFHARHLNEVLGEILKIHMVDITQNSQTPWYRDPLYKITLTSNSIADAEAAIFKWINDTHYKEIPANAAYTVAFGSGQKYKDAQALKDYAATSGVSTVVVQHSAFLTDGINRMHSINEIKDLVKTSQDLDFSAIQQLLFPEPTFKTVPKP